MASCDPFTIAREGSDSCAKVDQKIGIFEKSAAAGAAERFARLREVIPNRREWYSFAGVIGCKIQAFKIQEFMLRRWQLECRD